MYLTSSNPSKQLLLLAFIGQVTAVELAAGRENMMELLAGLKPGFRLLSDLTMLESFDEGCAAEIAQNMHLFSEKGVAMVVRVIPDESKDFGLNILSLFHYPQRPNVVTCSTMIEAVKALSL
jgi:hypothetical protein